jgi:hypothetical protein
MVLRLLLLAPLCIVSMINAASTRELRVLGRAASGK